MKIRLATKAASNNGYPVKSMDDVTAGVTMPWVELDGHRYKDVVNARVEMDSNGILQTYVTFQFIGPVEIVYVDREGNEIGTVQTQGDQLPEVMDYNTYFEVPPEINPEVIELSKKIDKTYRSGNGDIKPGWPGES